MTTPTLDVEGVTHREVQANGVRFHVAEYGKGDRLALCLHGFPQLWFSWRHLMPTLAHRGYRVWAPDLRGYGSSERPPRIADYDLEILMDDVAGLVDAAGARSTLLLGHDWGGMIAWYFAMRRLRPLEGLVIFNAPFPGIGGGSAWSLRQVLRYWYVLFFQLPRLPELFLGSRRAQPLARMFRETSSHPDAFPEPVIDVYRDTFAAPGALTPMLNYYRAMARSPGSRRQRALPIERIETPTLVVWGEQDMVLGATTIDPARRWIDDYTFHNLPDATHWVLQDDPKGVDARVEAWLEARAAGGTG